MQHKMDNSTKAVCVYLLANDILDQLRSQSKMRVFESLFYGPVSWIGSSKEFTPKNGSGDGNVKI